MKVKIGDFRMALYLSGYVDVAGNEYDAVFIRVLEDKLYSPSDVPKSCFVVSEQFDGVFWCSCGDEIHGDWYEGFRDGDICFATYPNQYGRLDTFYAEVLVYGEYYCRCKLFFGATFDPLKVYGTFDDVCTMDLDEIY